MSVHDETSPARPAENESLPGLFKDILRLANQAAARISQRDVEARLHRVLRRAGQNAAGAAGTCPDLAGHLESFLQEVEQSIAGLRQELAVITAETQQTFELATSARAQAEDARESARATTEEAIRAMGEADEYQDAAVRRDALIVREARSSAEEIMDCAEQAAGQLRFSSAPELLLIPGPFLASSGPQSSWREGRRTWRVIPDDQSACARRAAGSAPDRTWLPARLGQGPAGPTAGLAWPAGYGPPDSPWPPAG